MEFDKFPACSASHANVFNKTFFFPAGFNGREVYVEKRPLLLVANFRILRKKLIQVYMQILIYRENLGCAFVIRALVKR